jgi:glycosyltransferase involved in cell wall biosynthesis
VYHIADHGYGDLAAVLPPERTVISCHDLTLLCAAEGTAGFRPGRVSLARFRWSTSYLRRAAHVVCPTEATKRDIVRLRGVAPERITVAPYGVDSRFRAFEPDLRARLKAALPGAPAHALLHVSTGDPYKNVEGTLRAVARVRANGRDVRLYRAGRPLSPSQQLLAASLRVEHAVLDLGFVPDERLVDLYNGCDVLLFPSFYEGYGWPPLEAMACGTPVVAADCAALAETLGEAAILAPAEDAAALTAGVERVLDEPLLAHALRIRGRARAARYTWPRTIDAFARVYASVARVPAIDRGSELERPCAA